MSIETIETVSTVVLSEYGLAILRDKVEKLNKRAVRHGMVKLGLRVVSSELIGGNLKYCVEISGCEPRINGYRFIARIEFNDIVGTLVHVAPGCDDYDLSSYRESSPVCEHCNTKRKRNDIFVLEGPDGNRARIGRNCLADYLRCGDAATLTEWAACMETILTDDSDDCERDREFFGRTGYPVPALRHYLAVVHCCMRRMGWMSRTAARDCGGNSTADQALFVIFGRGAAHTKFINHNDITLCDKDFEIADCAMEWAKNVETKSEYLYTISRIATTGHFDCKLAGYAASIISAYQRECDRITEREDKAKNAPCKVWIGDKGKRFRDQPVTIKRVRYIDGDYGVRTILAMEAAMPNGEVAPITWFASGEHNYEEGSEWLLTATVKDHDENEKWGKQTIVSRSVLK